MEQYEIKPLIVGSDFLYKSKNNKSQRMTLKIQAEEYDSLVYWNVVLWIGKNKRGYEFDKQTGRDGIKSLLWAKKCLISFMEDLERHNLTHHMIISWDNNRRKKAYMRGLYDLGFRLARIEQRIWLHKIV